MAPHSSTLAWKIPWMEEPGRLQSMGLWRVGHDWVTSLSLFTFMHWRRKWQLTPMFLPGESQRRGSLVGCRLWGRTELDTTKVTQQQQQLILSISLCHTHHILFIHSATDEHSGCCYLSAAMNSAMNTDVQISLGVPDLPSLLRCLRNGIPGSYYDSV